MKRLFVTLGLCLTTMPALASDEYTFVAAPRGSQETETALYQPIMDYLSKTVGVKIQYKYIGDWLTYRKTIRDNNADFYFNGPHFSSWLVTHRNHRFIGRLAETHTFIVAVRTNENRIRQVSDLAGRSNCLHPEPNLGTLIFETAFPNPARQPVTVLIDGWKNAYAGIIDGKCLAAVMPINVFEKQNKQGYARILHKFDTVPNQALTASPRVPPELLEKIKSAILSNGCQDPCKKLLEVYASKGFNVVDEKDYLEVGKVLKDDFLLGDAVIAAEQQKLEPEPIGTSINPQASKLRQTSHKLNGVYQ